MPLSTFGTFFVGSIAETVWFLVCPVGNQQFEVLLAEGNLVDGLNAVATASRPTAGSPRSILQAAFNACSISQPHTTVNAALCSTRRPAAAFRCTPQATAISSPALATMCEAIDTVSGVETDVSHNVRNCRDGMFIAFCAHFVVFFTVHSWLLSLHRPMRLSDTRRFQPLSNRVPILRNRIKRACVFVKRINGKINLNRVFRLRWLCKGRACRVQPFMLSLSVFLGLCAPGILIFFSGATTEIFSIPYAHPARYSAARTATAVREVHFARNRLFSLCYSGKGSVSLFCSFPFAVGWHVLCPVLVEDLLSYFWKTVSLGGAV